MSLHRGSATRPPTRWQRHCLSVLPRRLVVTAEEARYTSVLNRSLSGSSLSTTRPCRAARTSTRTRIPRPPLPVCRPDVRDCGEGVGWGGCGAGVGGGDVCVGAVGSAAAVLVGGAVPGGEEAVFLRAARW